MKEKEMNILRSEVIAFTDKAFKNELEEIYSLNIEQSDKELLESVLNTNSVDIKKLLTHMIRILDVYRRSANSIEKSNNLMFGLNTEISDSLKQIREIESRVNVEKIKEAYDNIEVLSDKMKALSIAKPKINTQVQSEGKTTLNINVESISKPLSSNNKIEITQVYNLQQPKTREFNECRGYVVAAYQEFLEKQWIAELKQKFPVSINNATFESMVRK